MKKINTLLVILLFAIAGCGDNRQSTNDIITVDVTKSYPKKELILQDILDVEYIPLETNDEFVTQAIFLAIGKDVMMFRDRSFDGDVFVFDRVGKALMKINRCGQSGEEYTNVQDIIIDENNGEMFINNTFSSNVLVYDLLWNFKRSFKNSGSYFYNRFYDFDRDHLICHDEPHWDPVKENSFSLVSKQDGSIKEIQIPYKENISTILTRAGADGMMITRGIYHRVLIPGRDGWILTEPSSDTVYRYSPTHTMTPIIVREPSVQSMDPEVFLFPGVLTDRYCFMQTVKKTYDFNADKGFPRTDLVYDRQENVIFECVVYNDDFTNKTHQSLVYEVPMFTFVNSEIAIMKKLEADELIEAYEKGQLKGKLKEIAAGLDKDSNPVIMLIKYKK